MTVTTPAKSADRRETRPQRSTMSKVETRRQRWGWVFVLPFVIVFTVFLIVPLCYAFWLSLHNKGLATGGKSLWVGFDNYTKAFTDPEFLHGLLRVAAFVVVMVPIQIGFALLIALVLDTLTTKLSRFTRLMIFIPYAVPAMIGALMWGFLYSPRFGPGADLFGIFGLSPPDFLSSNFVFMSLVNVVTWQWVGYYMIIIYSALRAVDPSMYEAATIDGAGPWQVALRIKVPMVVSSLVMITIFALIGTLQFFTEPTILRGVAQGAISASYTPNMYAYALAFSYNQFNYASAIAFALGVVVFLGSYVFLFVTRKQNGLK